jgi:hypothetical protein
MVPNPTHPIGTNSGDPPAHTLPYRHDLSQPVGWATVQHLPPLVLTDLVRYSHDSTSSSISEALKFWSGSIFSEPTAVPRQISTSPLSTHKTPVQQIRPQPTPTAVHPRPTVPVQRIRTQTPTEPLHSANDDDKSHITDLQQEYYQQAAVHPHTTIRTACPSRPKDCTVQ